MSGLTEPRAREIFREEIGAWWRGGASVAELRKLGLGRDEPALKTDHGLNDPDHGDADVEIERAEVVVVLKQLQVLDQLGTDGQAIRYRGQLWVLDHETSPTSSSGLDTGSVGERPGSGTSPGPGHPAGGDS